MPRFGRSSKAWRSKERDVRRQPAPAHGHPEENAELEQGPRVGLELHGGELLAGSAAPPAELAAVELEGAELAH